ncbi:MULTISPECIES: extracellular solute-binding protein [Microbacterium]|uniref:Extracellular solute-binding protein n=1 Tax=Microbacterium wangchenii TaxID=2541726 RepID=A0ABX5SRW9_9MICO|nr:MULTISPECIES: extracellular solute-binding protein [Microbacterium]MCK6066617.1 extracellular solute-binding protein [Microbacterium sp. EYE_512]QBR87951.1 extracellular solute-binding protein [Microbacterium wangchenii]TXK18259.1 extracellular solute-binding protein [Microbacterium wangchenii]
MRRRILITAATATGILALTACGGGGGGGGGTEGRGEITIWYSNNESEIAWGEQMVEAWNSENPDEQIRAQEIPAGSSSEEVIGAAITAGNAPCLIFNTSPAAVPGFQRQGGLVNLSEFEDGDDYITERSGEVAEQYRSEDGDFYQMPWKSNPVVIFYNKALFEQAGLDPENPALSTYDEFLQTARTLKESGVADFAINPAPTSEFFQSWFDFYPLYAAQTGGTQLVEEGEATFDDENGTAVAEFWRTLYAEQLAGNEQYQGDAFADGYAAMAIVGPWAINVYGEDVDWGAVPVPTQDGTDPAETWTFSDAKNVGMFTACENQATAWDVLKFATSEEQDGIWLEETGQMPLRQDLSETYADFFEANPAYALFGDQAARTVEVPNVPNSVEIWQAFRDGYSRAVIFGEDDVQTFLTDSAEQINELAAGN